MNANKLENWEILNSMQSIHGIWFSLLGIPRETCRHPHSNFEEHWSLRFQLLLKTRPLGERPPMRHCFKKRISTLGREKGLKAGLPRNMALHNEALFCETTGFEPWLVASQLGIPLCYQCVVNFSFRGPFICQPFPLVSLTNKPDIFTSKSVNCL